jgi:hypothetical protein
MDNWDKDGRAVAGLHFGNSPWPDRLAWAAVLVGLIMTVLPLGYVTPIWMRAMLSTAMVASAFLVSWARFAGDNGMQKLRLLIREKADADRDAADARKEISHREAELKKILDDLDTREVMLQAKIANAQSQERGAVVTAAQTLAAEKARLQRERDQAQRDLDDGLRRMRDQAARAVADFDRQVAELISEEAAEQNKGLTQKQVNDIDRQIAALDAAEAAERNKAVGQKQKDHIRSVLQAARVMDADIHLIGPKLKDRLCRCGFVTAADINPSVTRVSGIGPTRGSLAMSWRHSVEARAERTKPTALTSAEDKAIHQRFESRRSALMARKQNAQTALAAEHRAIRDQFSSRRAALLAQKAKVQSSMPAAEQTARPKLAQTLARLDQEEKAKHREAEVMDIQARTKARAVIEEAQRNLDQLRQERQSPRVAQAQQPCVEACQQLAPSAVSWPND